MATDNKESGQNGHWFELYKAAIFEGDSDKIAGRIAEAHNAIRERRLQLWNEGSLATAERELLEDAVHFLELLRDAGQK